MLDAAGTSAYSSNVEVSILYPRVKWGNLNGNSIVNFHLVPPQTVLFLLWKHILRLIIISKLNICNNFLYKHMFSIVYI